MPVGMFCVAPYVADVWVKMLFSVVYASFGFLHLVRLRGIVANEGPSRTQFAVDPVIGFVVGALGGLLASVIGVGADILLYGVLVLLYHTDIKVAIPSAVILMAFTSLVGVGCTALASSWSTAGPASLIDVFPYWLAAAPVVAVGGPLGSLVSRHVPRRAILGGVAVLCLSQYAWTCYHEHIVGWSLVLAALGGPRREPGAARRLRVRPAITAVRLGRVERAGERNHVHATHRDPEHARLADDDQPPPRHDEPGALGPRRRAGVPAIPPLPRRLHPGHLPPDLSRHALHQ